MSHEKSPFWNIVLHVQLNLVCFPVYTCWSCKLFHYDFHLLYMYTYVYKYIPICTHACPLRIDFFLSSKRDCGYYKWFAVHWLHAIIWFFSPCVCSESFLLIYCYLSCYLLLMVVRDFLHFSMQSSWLWKKLNYHESVYMPLLFLVFVLFFI